MTIKEKLELLLSDYHLSKARLAKIIGISLPSLEIILNGGSLLPDKMRAVELALKDFVNVFNS